MRQKLLILVLLSGGLAECFSQNTLHIIDLLNNERTILEEKDYAQFYYSLGNGEKVFVYGRVRFITDSSVIMNNGGEIKLRKVLNIDRVPVMKRSWLPIVMTSVPIGVTSALTNMSLTTQNLLMVPAIMTTFYYALKMNKRHLKRNEIGLTVDIIIMGGRAEERFIEEYFNTRSH